MADEIIRWPEELLVEPVEAPDVLRPNQPEPYPKRPGAYVAPGRRRRRPPRGETIEPALDLYAGFRSLLFRTAVIRTEQWREGEVGPIVGSFDAAVDILKHMAFLDHEEIVTLCVDGRNRLIGVHLTAVGGLHGAAVSAREVLTPPLLVRASAFILAHNHPSGDPTPSSEDIMMTKAIVEASGVVGVAMLDHIVIAQSGGRVEARSLLELGAIR